MTYIIDMNRLFSVRNFEGSEIKKIREIAHLTQNEFAKMLNVSLGTLRNWEQGRRKPDGAAIALLKVFVSDPDKTAKILNEFTMPFYNSEKEKEAIINSLNWDYDISSSEVLIRIQKDSDYRNRLFVKTFQYLHWQDVVRFWGLELCLKMFNPDVRKMIIPSLRGKYDFIYRKILKTDISNAGFGASDNAKLYNSILSHRRNRSE